MVSVSKNFYNNKTLLDEVYSRTGYFISNYALWTWLKAGKVVPTGYFQNGKQRRPIYDETVLNKLVDKITQSRKKGRVRIKF